jgi:hypothetical protein
VLAGRRDVEVIVVAQGRDLDTLEAALEECVIGRAIELHCAGGCVRAADAAGASAPALRSLRSQCPWIASERLRVGWPSLCGHP